MDRLAAGADEDAFEAGTSGEEGKTPGKAIPSVSVLAKIWYAAFSEDHTSMQATSIRREYTLWIHVMANMFMGLQTRVEKVG